MQPENKSHDLIYIVDDDPDITELVAATLDESGHRPELFADAESALAALERADPVLVLLDMNLPGMNGLECLTRIKLARVDLPVVMMTVENEIESIVAAVQLGAVDYLTKPLDNERLLLVTEKAVEFRRVTERLADEAHNPGDRGYLGMVGNSPEMLSFYRRLDQAAREQFTILVLGESGTGKELAARALHTRGERHAGPFVALNCAAIPETMQEDELFGHEKGAFTGAVNSRAGRFELADGGTLFLDEVAELSPAVQAKLLRVIESGSFMRVGGVSEISSDFRIIAATHRDLWQAVEEKQFRHDLYYRLAVFELQLPALRDRKEDIPLLAMNFLKQIGSAAGRKSGQLSPQALDTLLQYDWPGNVRELRSTIQSAYATATRERIEVKNLPDRVRLAASRRSGRPDEAGIPGLSFEAGADTGSNGGEATLNLDALEARTIEQALRATEGNNAEAARLLGIARTTLYRKRKRFGLL